MAELDGSIFDQPAAAFGIIFYFVCTHLDLPPFHELLVISNCCFQELKDSEEDDSEEDDSMSKNPSDGLEQL